MEKQIILYIKAGDPYSDMIKNLLKYYNIKFDTIEVSRSKEKQEELFEISGQSNTPVLKMGEKVYVGFDREKIKEILGIRKENSIL